MTGHVGFLPVEELIPTLLGGGGAWVILRLTSLRRRPGSSRTSPTERLKGR